MNLMQKAPVVVAALLISGASLAVGRSDGVGAGGGGGVYRVQAVGSGAVKLAVKEYVPFLALTWLYRVEDSFLQQSSEEKAKSPFRKLFQSDQSILELIRRSSIEVRETEPCYDGAGQPVDASIYAHAPHSVCISDFTLGAKLDALNYIQQATALIIHEYSHLLGTTELEAVAIQGHALSAFSSNSPSALVSNLVKLRAELSDHTFAPRLGDSELKHLKEFARGFGPPDYGQLLALNFKLIEAWRKFHGNAHNIPDRLWLVPAALYRRLGPMYAKFLVASQYLCTRDDSTSLHQKYDCANWLNGIFQERARITAAGLFSEISRNGRCTVNELPDPCPNSVEYESVVIKRPTSIEDAKREVQDFVGFVEELKQSLHELSQCTNDSKTSGSSNCLNSRG